MHIAIDKGQAPGKTFAHYVDSLLSGGHIATEHKAWVTRIRTAGNHANHSTECLTQVDAEDILSFTEMLLRTVYEFPKRALPKLLPPQSTAQP